MVHVAVERGYVVGWTAVGDNRGSTEQKQMGPTSGGQSRAGLGWVLAWSTVGGRDEPYRME